MLAGVGRDEPAPPSPSPATICARRSAPTGGAIPAACCTSSRRSMPTSSRCRRPTSASADAARRCRRADRRPRPTSRCRSSVRHKRRLERTRQARRAPAQGRYPQPRLARQRLAGEAPRRGDGLAALELPTLEPRGAVMAELLIGDRPFRVIGMHLDLSGLWRRRQMRAILEADRQTAAQDADHTDGRHQRMARRAGLPQGAERQLPCRPRPAPASIRAGRSRRLDRIIVDQRMAIEAAGVHASHRLERVRPSSDLGRWRCSPTRLPAILRCRRRWMDEPIPIASRYLATVRRATSMPRSLSSRPNRIVAQNLGFAVDQLALIAP